MGRVATLRRIDVKADPGVKSHPIGCVECMQRHHCLAMACPIFGSQPFGWLMEWHKCVHSGCPLYHRGDRFRYLYVVHSGFFITIHRHLDGHDQITGFHIPGEVIGMDGVGGDVYTYDAMALEDSTVCAIPFHRLEDHFAASPALLRHFHQLMGRETVREYGALALLDSTSAERRVVMFLLDLSQRYAAQGFSSAEFNLRMTRREIGSYLGLKLETVSRVFSRLQDTGLIHVQDKSIHLIDGERLEDIAHRQTMRRNRKGC